MLVPCVYSALCVATWEHALISWRSAKQIHRPHIGHPFHNGHRHEFRYHKEGTIDRKNTGPRELQLREEAVEGGLTERRQWDHSYLGRGGLIGSIQGLMHASERHGFEGEGFSYLKSPIWWGGTITLALGEVANFAAYAFAPAILVTPLGALSVLIGAVLGSYFLHERLGTLGKLGCAMCLLGSVVIVLHAPPDKPVERIDEILAYAVKPVVAIFSTIMIYRVAPVHGKKNPPHFYLDLLHVKLTLGGNNQFVHASTYVFAIVTAFCILTQMNYINKALNSFSTSIVNPLYYVTFTTATLCASFILFQGFNTTDAVNTISLLCGFLIIFTGVYLLNLSRHDPDGKDASNGKLEDGVPTDAISSFQTRRSMQSRRSSSSIAFLNGSGDREGLIHSYDLENNSGIGLEDLAEDSDGGPGPTYTEANRERTALHTKRNSQI
ncbi:magnesium transporter NIPA5 [Penicillium chermesinum]|nr:magnesium transporter NIPA5 [Penicillium chermesinum]